jgi:hypothetical protein
MAEFNRVFRVQGMDSNTSLARFQMVPVGGSRFVALHDGAGMTVTNLNPQACTLTEIRESQLPSDERAGCKIPLDHSRAMDELLPKNTVATGHRFWDVFLLFHSATPAPSFSLCRVSRLTPALVGFGPKNLMITEKNTGVRKIPKKVTPIMPANTAVPSA